MLAGCGAPQPERKRGVPRVLLGADDEADDDDVDDDEDVLDDDVDDDAEDDSLLRAAPVLEQGLDLDAIIAATGGAARPAAPGQRAACVCRVWTHLLLARGPHSLSGELALYIVCC